jgi:hypothetical protein
MPIESVEQLAALRAAAIEGTELSLEQLREISDFIRAQRGIRGPKKGAVKKEKAKIEMLDTRQSLAKMFGF